jgi:hypothetical protein
MQVLLSYFAHAGTTVLRVFVISNASVYWITRWSLSSGGALRRPVGG